jgi:hypothetical protein
MTSELCTFRRFFVLFLGCIFAVSFAGCSISKRTVTEERNGQTTSKTSYSLELPSVKISGHDNDEEED